MRALLCIVLIVCLVLPCAALEPASVIAVFHIREGKITPVSSQIVYGSSPNIFSTHGDYIVSTRNSSGASETGMWISDPTLVRYLEVEEGGQSVEYIDDVDFTVVFPFRTDTATVAVYDRDKKIIAETDLGGAKNAFCAAHPLDERCRGIAAVLGIGALFAAGVAGAGVYLVLKRRKTGGD